MIGQKLHELFDVLSISHMKILDFKCLNSSDKRFGILKLIIHEKGITLEKMNLLLNKEVQKIWPLVNEKEHNLKIRRIVSFCIDQIEKVILESFLEKNTSAKNVILANAIEKSGNMNLLNRYFDKAYSISVEEEDSYYQLMGLKGKIRMKYASQSDKDLSEALNLNEEFIKVLKYNNDQKLADYYNNISNIYLEKNAIVKSRKKEVNTEINDVLKRDLSSIHKVSLYFSLAKLNYDDTIRDFYFQKAKDLLLEIENKNNEFFLLERRIRFLELRLSFFTGKNLNTLIGLTNEILQSNQGFSIINNNTLFYNILFHILNDECDVAIKLLEENHLFFKGSGEIMENFLRAVIYESKGEFKNAVQLLNPIMYASQYFFAIFARLMLIKIHLKRENKTLCKSLVDSTSKFLKQNSGNPLGKEANECVLRNLKKRIGIRGRDKSRLVSTPNTPNSANTVLSVFHEYLLK